MTRPDASSSPAPDVRGNPWVAQHLRELALRLEIDGDPHRPRAYRRAAETIEELGRPVARLYAEQGQPGLDSLPGIGPHIAATVAELLDSGRLRRLDKLRAKAPVDLDALLAIEGVGPRTVKILWEKLGVRDVEDLQRVLDEGRVHELPGFGHKREERLRRSLRISRRGPKRVARKRAAAFAGKLKAFLERLPEVVRCEVAGSIRRGSPTVGDIDLVVASDDAEGVADAMLSHPDVESVYARGPYRVSVRMKSEIDVDVRIVAPSCFGSALLYFTGNRGHTVKLRRLALAQDLRLNEYGLFRDGHRVAGETEEGVYGALSLPYIPPNRRRGGSEIRDALRGAG